MEKGQAEILIRSCFAYFIRSWGMDDETRHTPISEASLLRQITNAENEKKMQYFISVPTAYYEIEYGLVKGGGKGA